MKFERIDAGAHHLLVVSDISGLSDPTGNHQPGQLYVAGGNNSGELGILPQHDQREVRGLFALKHVTSVRHIAAGLAHSLFVTSTTVGTDTLWGMGNNQSGQLGLSEEGVVSTPTQVRLFANKTSHAQIPIRSLPGAIVAVAAGAAHSAVRYANGSVVTFGRGTDGQLGHSFQLLSDKQLDGATATRRSKRRQKKRFACSRCG